LRCWCFRPVQKRLRKSRLSNDAFPIPAGFPKIEFPDDNQFTIERWKLGKKLFYEKALSLNNTVSCGSCHKPELAFSDNVALSLGDSGKVGRSNAPTLANVAYHPYFTRAGGVPTLEMQILVPIQEHDEFNNNIVDIAERLKQIPAYVEAAQNMLQPRYGSICDYPRHCCVRTFIDQWKFSIRRIHPKRRISMRLTSRKNADWKLFLSEKTNCSKCHTGFDFTNYAFENNGLYTDYADLGRFRVTGVETDRAKFKVPSLRNM
jgi:cytochrome c peroxidase